MSLMLFCLCHVHIYVLTTTRTATIYLSVCLSVCKVPNFQSLDLQISVSYRQYCMHVISINLFRTKLYLYVNILTTTMASQRLSLARLFRVGPKQSSTQ